LAGVKRFALQLHMAVVGIFWELVRKFWSEPADESRHQNGSTVRSKGVKQMSAMLKSEQILPEGGLLLLDEARDLLSEGQVPGAFKRLVSGLAKVRDELSPEDWKAFSRQECFTHPIRELLHQSPFSRRSFEKPRGYAGDAVVLDFAYGCAPLPAGTTDLGAQIYQCELYASSVKSARDRRDALAAAVDGIARQTRYPKILSVACGHLREATLSKAVAEGKIDEYVALDHDPISLSVIDEELPGKRITTIHGSVRDLIKRQIRFQDFDLVYSAGLFDYLTMSVATALTKLMFYMLKPGGRLLVANCAPESECIGYMEAFMGWHLIYRNEAELMPFASSIPESEIKSIGTFRDLHQNMIFLEVVRS
jgi:extracellular factor (EF) 3-hydroxypalmitic acid methyl ester biosynthesis protein